MSEIPYHFLASAFRIFAAALFAVPIGIVMGLSASGKKHIVRFINFFMMPMPKAALLPLVIMAFGLGELSKTALLFLCLVFPLSAAVCDAADAVSKTAAEPFIAAGCKRSFIYFKIILPESIPYVIAALKQSTATALSVLFFAESYGTDYGLGFFILDRFIRCDYFLMSLGIAADAAAGGIIIAFLDVINRRYIKKTGYSV